jgi:hypothetical protein
MHKDAMQCAELSHQPFMLVPPLPFVLRGANVAGGSFASVCRCADHFRSAWPLAAWRQQPSLPPLIGVLSSGPAKLREDQSAGLRRGLKEAGFAEGDNLTVLYSGADDHYDRLPALAADLGRSVMVIATAGGPVAALAAKSATATIPIVFAAVSDPVKSGLVAVSIAPEGMSPETQG